MILKSNGAQENTVGSGAQFIYVIEPSGNRVEIWTGGFLIFAPDWEPIEWSPEVGLLGLDLWGSIAPGELLQVRNKITVITIH